MRDLATVHLNKWGGVFHQPQSRSHPGLVHFSDPSMPSRIQYFPRSPNRSFSLHLGWVKSSGRIYPRVGSQSTDLLDPRVWSQPRVEWIHKSGHNLRVKWTRELGHSSRVKNTRRSGYNPPNKWTSGSGHSPQVDCLAGRVIVHGSIRPAHRKRSKRLAGRAAHECMDITGSSQLKKQSKIVPMHGKNIKHVYKIRVWSDFIIIKMMMMNSDFILII